MNIENQIKRILSALLVFVLLITFLPVNTLAAESSHPIVLIAGGDYQQAGDHTNSSTNISNILKKITATGITAVDGFLFVGDYDCETHDSSSETSAGIQSLMSTMTNVFSNLNYDNTILVQGNHDYPDSRIDATGGHTFDGYSVFVMNEDDYPNYGGSESQAKTLSAKLDAFLSEKLAEGYTAPIFVTSHVPLHFGPRTNRQGDGKYGRYYFDVMNHYGAEGLNIVFMHGHNHAYGYDEYLGGEAIFLTAGDKINIAKNGSQSSYDTYTLNFTYMNAGYTGYYNESGYSTSSGTDFLTMTTFQIYDDRMVINRFSEDGLYNLKTAGEKKGDYISSVSVSANTTVYSSSQTVILNAPAERITLEDSATGITVSGLKVEDTFDDNSDLTVVREENISVLENSAKCSAYQAYTLDFAASGTVKVTLPVPSTYSASNASVYLVEGSTLTKIDADFAGSSLSFVTAKGGTYALVKEVSATPSASVYYERVDSLNQLVSGEQYLIVFDCSSQTTADAIVIPEIATYGSGSSKRMGPDVVVSDGIGNNTTITGNHDPYLWTLTKSGNGWLIGNGAQNINVTYSSTTNRCELAFTTSGEALTIAAASNNPSDADNWSFAIYDSNNYYWQYNTSATLIYGTSGDSYTSRFCFYKRVENTATEPTIPNGWISVSSEGTYTLDTDGVDVGQSSKYIIVGSNNNYALSLSGNTVGRVAATISGNTATVSDPSACEFYFKDNSSAENGSYLLTQDGSKSIYHSGGNMYYGTDNKGYWHIGSASGGFYQLYDYDNLNWYLNYGYVWDSEAVSRFAVSSTARNVRLFKTSDIYVRLVGDTMQSINTADNATEASVLSNLSIQTTEDGYVISDTIAVTGEMVEWDTAFDGTMAGTYIGTVTYEGVKLGTVTVTVAGHSFETVTVDPTCTEDGSVTTKCTICGETTVEILAALGHNYESVVKDATCSTNGSIVYNCSVCNDTYTEEIPATGNHTLETVTVDPTCTEDGSVTTKCTGCGETTVEILTAFGHNYERVVNDATCGTNGSIIYSCSTCNDTYIEEIPATGNHTLETIIVDPTCTEDGYTTYSCAVCGYSYTDNPVAALGHNYNAVVTEPTYSEMGYTTHTCTVCGDSYVDSYVDALSHSFETETQEATCTEDGFVSHTCTDCGYSYTETIPAFGHDYKTVAISPTCVADGSVVSTCGICGDTQSQTIPATGHSYETTVIAPTCTEDGVTVSTCTCGDVVTVMNPATGHSYQTVVTAPTCTKDGYTTYTCTACGESHTANAEAALGHNYTSHVTAPTCTKDGYTTYTCTVCGESHIADETAAVGHSYNKVVTTPTCTEGGYTTYTCTVCGESHTADKTVALGHSYNTEEADGYLIYTCRTCGHTYSEKLVVNLSYNKVTSFAQGESYVITLVSGNKYYALSHKNNTLSAVRVTVSNNKITSEVTEDLLWEYSNSTLSYEDNGTTRYLHVETSGNWWNSWLGTPTLTISTSSSSNVSISNNRVKVGSYYLRYSSSKIVANRNSSTAALFVETAE